MLRKLLETNTLYYFFITVLERLTFFAFYIVLARILSVDNYGLIVTVFAFINILSPFLELGLPFFIQREVAKGNNIQVIFNSALTLKFLILPFYILLPFVYFNSYLTANYFILISISIIQFLIFFNLLFQSLLYGFSDFKHPFKAIIITRIFFFLCIAAFYYSRLEVRFFLILLITVLLIQLFLLGINFRNLLKSFKFVVDLSTLMKTIKSSLPIGIGLIFVTLSDRIDILILEKLIDLSSVAYYSVAYTIFRNIQIFSTVILVPEYTRISAEYPKDNNIASRKFKFYFKYLFIFAIFLIISSYFFADLLIVFLYGSQFSESSRYLILISLALPALFLKNLTGIICNATMNSNIPAYATGLGTIVVVLLNIILIPFWGILGTVLATIISEYFIFLYQLIRLRMKNVITLKTDNII